MDILYILLAASLATMTGECSIWPRSDCPQPLTAAT